MESQGKNDDPTKTALPFNAFVSELILTQSLYGGIISACARRDQDFALFLFSAHILS